jgi:subtilase family serine protease/flagellar hook assembly protein FlgD
MRLDRVGSGRFHCDAGIARVCAVLGLLALGATARGDGGQIAVVHVDPAAYTATSYDARAAAARAFYASHGDAYDFLIAFPTFSIDRASSTGKGETEGRHFLVSNAVQGTGIGLGRVAGDFGRSDRLKGYVDDYSLVPGDALTSVDHALAVIAHEVAHQWSGKALFRDPRTGQVSGALLGLEGSHWSYYLDSDASVLYGADWRDAGGGVFAADSVRKRYSALDLYLMGVLGPDEVGPITLLAPGPGITTPAASLPPDPGTRIPATAMALTVSDLVAAMGPRSPGSTEAQASFRAAFVIVAPPGQEPSAEQLAFVDSVRSAWANQFFFMTRGRAVMQTDLVESLPAPIATNPSLNLGVDYLLSRQRSDGAWSDDPGTVVRDTQVALEALAQFSSRADTHPAVAHGAGYLGGLRLADVDQSARQLLALRAVGVDPRPAAGAPFALELANSDGGQGLAPGYGSTVIDTVLATLARGGDSRQAIDYLLAVQNADGGWGLPGGPSDITSTCMVLQLIASAEHFSGDMREVQLGINYLLARLGTDWIFRDEEAGGDHTAEAVLALTEWGALPPSWIHLSLQALLATQEADGSWEGSVQRTATTLRALRALMLPNLAVRSAEVSLSAASSTDGEPVTARVMVRNLGNADASNAEVQAFDEAGRPFGAPAPIPSIAVGASTVVTLTLDTSGHAGSTQVFLVVDPGGLIDETTKEDNRVALPFAVQARPTLPDLFVAGGSLVATPSSIIRVGSAIQVTAQVGNSGLTDVPAATVSLLSGSAVIASSSIPLTAGSSQVVSLAGTLPSAGLTQRLTVVLDPENAVQEARKDNNAATLTLPYQPTVDLAVQLAGITPSPVDLGTDVAIRYAVSNSGTAAATALSRVVILDAGGGTLATLSGPSLSIASGGTASGAVTWRASVASATAVRVEVPVAGDLDPSNNSATSALVVNASGKPNLAVRGLPTITPSPPLEGKPATVSLTVQNLGQGAAGATVVELWLGDPAAGGHVVGRAAVAPLAGGAASDVALAIASAPGAPIALVARVDPDNAVDEYDETDNSAVLYLEPLRRPDLALRDGALQPSSLFPRRGDRVSVGVVVDNLGDQPADPARVELFAGAPESGGVLLGATTAPAIAPRATAPVAFDWDTSGWDGQVELVAIVNRDGSANDARADDNRVARTVLVQGGRLALSNPYFSPNGDGVKDTTEVFFRLDGQGSAVAAIRDERGRTIRTLAGTTSPDGSGSLSWDGRTDAGTLAYDGRYEVTVQGAGAMAPLGSVAVVLDTDRASVLETPTTLRVPVVLSDGIDAMFPFSAPNTAATLAGVADEQAAIYHVQHVDRAGVASCGYYRVPLDGDLPERLTPPGFPCAYFNSLALSPDGRDVYRTEWQSQSGWYVLTRYDLAAQSAAALTRPEANAYGFVLGPDRSTLEVSTWQGPLTVDMNTGTLGQGIWRGESPVWALDGSSGAFLVNMPHGPELHVVNPDGSGERAVLVTYPEPLCLEGGGDFAARSTSSAVARTYDPYCRKWESLPIPTPDGAYVLPEGALLGAFAWVSPTEIAYQADGIWLLDLAGQTATQLVTADELPIQVTSLAADPAGRNLAITGWDQAQGPQLWSLNLASGRLDFAASWSTAPGDLQLAFTRFGAALIGEHVCGWQCRDQPIDLFSQGNLGLSVIGLRQSGSAEIVFRGTVADLNLDSWELTASDRHAGGAPISVASGTAMVVSGELARWTAPRPGSWDLTLTGKDLAGNVRSTTTVVSWAEVPAIANVRAKPRYFSPNGDGVQDDVAVSYSVQEPVTTTIDVTSSSGALVRSIPVTQASVGDYALRWDGRDDGGAVLADDTYAISADGSRAQVILDTTPPEVSLEIGPLQPTFTSAFIVPDRPAPGGCPAPQPKFGESPTPPNDAIPLLAVPLTYSASDANLERWGVEAASEATPGDFVEVLSGSSSDSRPITAGVRVADLPGGILRLRATDLAGNVATTVTSEVPELLTVSAFGPAYFALPSCGGWDLVADGASGSPFRLPSDPGISQPGWRAIPRLDMLKLTVDRKGNKTAFCYQRGYHAFALASTIRAPLAGAAIAYREDGATDWTVDQEHVALTPHGAVLWDARTGPKLVVELEMRVTDASGRVFAAPVEIHCTPANTVNKVDPVCGTVAGLDEVPLTATSSMGQQVWPPPEFALRDAETGSLVPIPDPTITTTGSPSDPAGTLVELTADIRADKLPGCVYDVVTLDGTTHKLTGDPPLSHFEVCGLAAAHLEVSGDAAYLSLSARYRKPVSRVDVYAAEPGAGRILIGSAPGFTGTSAPFALDLTPFSFDVPLSLSTRTVFADGSTTEEQALTVKGTCNKPQELSRPGISVQVMVAEVPAPMCSATPSDRRLMGTAASQGDRLVDLALGLSTPAGADLLLTGSPVTPGTSVSTSALVSATALAPSVWSAVARATDASGQVFASSPVSFSTVPTPPWLMQITAPQAGGRGCPVMRSGPTGQQRRMLHVEGAIGGDQLTAPRMFLACGAESLNPVNYESGAGGLGEIDVSARSSSDCQLMVEERDASGASYCTTPIPFHLVGNGALQLGASPALFSPNADGKLDVAQLTLSASEPTSVTVTATDSAQRSGVALVVDVSPGVAQLPWDGLMGGRVAADGDVRLHATAADPCGNPLQADAIVRIDTTPPLVRIDGPESGTRVSGVATLTGQVSDDNFLDYDVAIGAGSAPAQYQPVAASDRPAKGKLGEVDVSTLAPGSYTIRVHARDRAGNESGATVAVEVTTKQLIRSLAVVPALVSPNDDGILDASVARYELFAPATVSVDLVGADGKVVPVLPPMPMPASVGQVDLPLSFLAPLSDGSFAVRLTATSGNIEETESALLTLDRAPPTVAVTDPAQGAVVARPATIRGQVDDDHLDTWTLSLFHAGTSTALASGHAPLAGALAPLVDLAEGDYTATLTAADGAGNHATTSAAFSVDRTPPALTLTAPAADSWVSGRSGAIEVAGDVVELHPGTVHLVATMADGTPAELFSGATVPKDGHLASWDVLTLAEGPADLHLEATDAAGNTADVHQTVQVDNTPPAAQLFAPRDTFLRAGDPITGAAFDDHLATWTLELTTGVPTAASVWLPLADGTDSLYGATITSFSALPPDGAYGLRLTGTDLAGNTTIDVASFLVDTTPPAPPSGLVARLQGPDVALSWTGSPDADVVGYQVLRTGASGAFTPVTGIVPVTATVDPGILDGHYRYVVVAVDAAGLQSAPSSEATLDVDRTPPHVVITAPSSGASVSGSVAVLGTAFSNTDFKEYRLSMGLGDSPTDWTLLRRSGAPVVSSELGRLDAGALADGTRVTLRLEGEDLTGNVGEVRATVVVDDTPPAAPVLLTATTAGNSVQLTWQPSPDPDVLGYLVYRNGTITSLGQGAASASIAAHLLPASATSYVDGALPDGTYTYEVQAFDRALNASPLSNSLAAEIETQAPSATIAAPAALARLDGTIDVVAEVKDQDVASVQFQIRVGGESAFRPLGAPVTRVPFATSLDLSPLDEAPVELRAVATDTRGNVDPAPASTFVFHAPTPSAPSVSVAVAGADVDVGWSDSNPAGRVVGYELARDGASALPSPATPTGTATASVDAANAQVAVDGLEWTSWGADGASKPTWQLDLASPALIQGLELTQYGTAEVVVSVSVDGTWVPVHHGVEAGVHVALDQPLQVEGVRVAFPGGVGFVGLYEVSLEPLAVTTDKFWHDAGLALGAHAYDVTVVTAFGLRAGGSASGTVYAPQLDPPPASVASLPLQVTGTGATPGATVTLYRADAPVGSTVSSADGRFAADVVLVDGDNTLVARAVDPAGNVSLPSAPITVAYDAAPTAALTLRLVRVLDSSVDLAFDVNGDASRIAGFHLHRLAGGADTVVATPAAADRATTDSGLPNGTYTYTVAAFNAHGFEGPVSNAVVATIAIPVPPAAADLTVAQVPGNAALRLAWTLPSASGDRFLVERALAANGPFAALDAAHLVTATTIVDAGLTPGVRYFYRVSAVDSVGNAGPPSPVASGVPLAPALNRPSILAPTTPDSPIWVNSSTVDVGGLADPGALVELRRNGVWVGEARAGAMQVHGESIAGTQGGGFGASPDGREVAFVWSGWPTDTLVIYGPSYLWIQDPSYQQFGRVAFSPDGRWVAFEARSTSDGRGHLWVASMQDGTARPVSAAAGEEHAPSWSADGRQLAYETRRDGAATTAIAVLEVASMAEYVRTAPGLDLGSPGWTPDGSLLALASSAGGGSTEILRSAAVGWSEVASSDRSYTGLVVSPDGHGALLTTASASAPLDLLDLGTGSVSTLDATPAASRVVGFGMDGATVLQDRDGKLLRTVLATGATEDLGDTDTLQALAVTSRGAYAVTAIGEVMHYTWGGGYLVPGASLAVGKNLLVATEVDDSGGRSTPSEAISVTFDLYGVSDLALASLAVQPVLPVMGDTVTALVTIENRGYQEASATDLLVTLTGPDGAERQLPAAAVGTLVAGAKSAAVVTLGALGVPGTYSLRATVDPSGRTDDGDRSDNSRSLTFTVSPTRGVQLSVTAAPAEVGVDGTITATVVIANTGPATNATLTTRLVDEAGEVVSEAPPVAYQPLLGGTTTTVQRSLGVGLALAGAYHVVAELSGPGIPTGSASTGVAVLPERTVRLALAADRFTYGPGSDVQLASTVTNLSRNAALAGALRALAVLSASGDTVWSAPDAEVPGIWMGGAAQVAATIPAGTLPAGAYTALATVTLDGAVLAQATTTFTVVGQSQLSGTLVVAGRGNPPAVAAGSLAAASATITNLGTAGSVAATGRVILLSPAGDALWSQAFDLPALTPGASLPQTLAIPTTGLPLGVYGLALTVDVGGASSSLASASVRVADGTAPTLAVRFPASGAYMRGAVTPVVDATDAGTGVAVVRAVVGGVVTPLALISGNVVSGTWTGPIGLGPDGEYVIVLSAADVEGNDGLTSPGASDPVAVRIISDTIPPDLQVDGIANGALTNVPVVATVTASDLHLAAVRADIDGVPYVSGSPYAVEGRHVLHATAIDAAGNVATGVRTFDLDLTPPEVALLGVADGEYRDGPVTPTILVTDRSPTTSTATLDGVPWSSGTISTEGQHVLDVAARDAAGNSQEVAAAFWIDLTPPRIAITGVENGACVAHPVTPAVTIEEANPLSTTSTLDGRAFAPGTLVDADGDHALSVVALDRAGHRTTGQVSFAIDRKAPVVQLGALDGRYFAAPVVPSFSVTDERLVSSGATLDGAPYQAGTPLATEGRHALVVSGVDCAGNAASASATFVVDLTPPELVLLGATEGAVVPGPVAITASASDANLDSVALTLDGAPYTPGAAITAAGHHLVVGTARDLAGNTRTASLGFTVDGAAPRIAVDGIADGDVVGHAVAPIIRVTDDDLAGWEATVDGASFPQGGVVSGEGTHALAVVARDLAGNTSRLSLTFAIDLTPPVIKVEGVEGGVCYGADVTPRYSANDAHLASVAATLDGAAFASGTVVTAEQAHALVVTARDVVDQAVSLTVQFVIDKTAPVITLGDLDGRYFGGPVTVAFTVADANLVETLATLDGAPVANGATVRDEGTHKLVVTARDCAGHQVSATATFTVDLTPPVVSLSGVTDGAVVKSPVAITATVSDRSPVTVKLTLDGNAYVAGAAIRDAGLHTVVAVATDAAGHTGGASVGFTIDDTKPEIQIAGVEDGELTNQDVVPLVTVSDAHLTDWTTTVDGVELPTGGAVHAEGAHTLLVVAHDLAGNEAQEKRSFEIDRTSPVVSASVASGGSYPAPVTVTYSASDANLDKGSVAATLDGKAFASAGVVSAAGSYTLVVTAKDRAGNVGTATYPFTVTGAQPVYQVRKVLALDDLRVLARVACGAAGDRSAAFLSAALPGASVHVVRNDSDLLVRLRTGQYGLVVLTDDMDPDGSGHSGPWPQSFASGGLLGLDLTTPDCGGGGGGSGCSPVEPVPPLQETELSTRLDAELTEAVHRGVGLLVFRVTAPPTAWLREVLGLQFLQHAGRGSVTIVQSAASPAMQLDVPDGVALVLDDAWAIGRFDRDRRVAAALHGYGLGAVVVLGFDPAVATGEPKALLSRAATYALGEQGLTPDGSVAIRIEVQNGPAASTTRVRESLDPALRVTEIRNGGAARTGGGVEWVFDQAPGATQRLTYVVRLPEVAGAYQTTSEVARMVGGVATIAGTYPLPLQLQASAASLQADAERLASAISTRSCEGNVRNAILADLAAVRANPGRTAQDRERAIGKLLDAAARTDGLQSVDRAPLRLAIDALLAVWEARP